ncbi:MAG TPA: UvrD-helicase domain-containing protein [Candidatus Corynebacterium avicola]|uniref:DNA 3'-5' helicase n=1 Tax=Candidatus Corynebacterium avicola TaxID=2838527 RepID=A0A9D1UM39_9CORY|nr:UvrD-helicase domain-containing protein [Candidatus Corynebacterium avicola]
MSTPSNWTIIKASAGSGKTYRLTEILTERLSGAPGAESTGHQLHPSEIIATTFTRAAAAELKDRIRGTLVDRGMLDAAAAMQTALIGTVNSVTGRILTDFALDAGRSPELSVLTEQTQETSFRLATDSIIAEAEDKNRHLLARTGYDEADDRGYYATGVNWAATIRQVIDHARANNIADHELEGLAETSRAGLADFLDAQSGITEPLNTRSLLAGAARRLPDVLASEVDMDAKKPKPLYDRLPKLRSFANRVERESDILPWTTWLKLAEGKVPGLKGDPLKRIKETYGDVVTAEQILADPELRQDLDDLITLVFRTAASCMRAYAEYKDAMGLIDFTDQEQLTLRLLRGVDVDPATTAAVRETLAARYRVLVVDEFQDTSPLQLAVFTELASLVDEVIWVGDPKQSIYGFRGSDPALMDEAVRAITDPDGINGSSETLAHSYRTRQAPLDLSNRLFGHLFADKDTGSTEDVVLTVPDIRASEYQQDGPLAAGETMTWPHDDGDGRATKDLWYQRIADGLESLGEEPTSDGDLPRRAVLVRNNKHAAELRDVLRDRGISCSGAGTPLSITREGQLVRAALFRLIDHEDTQALVEMIVLMPDHPAHETWFEELTGAEDRDAREELFDAWAEDRTLVFLDQLRSRLVELTVPEIIEEIIDGLDLRFRVAASASPVTRNGAVLGILQAAADYVSEQESAGKPSTTAGFLEHLDEDDTTSSPVTEAGAVEIQTVHRSKGLEWDTVIVALPDGWESFQPAGVWVHSDEPMSMDDPLAGRQITFWPETLLAHKGVKEALLEDPVQMARRTSDLLEEQRLLYVAMTRSKFRTVLAPYSSIGKWKSLKETKLEDEEIAELTADSTPLVFDKQSERPTPAIATAAVLDAKRQGTPTDREVIPATFTASSTQATDELTRAATVTVVADLGEALISGGGDEWNKVGDCIHSYLAAPLGILAPEMKQSVASRLVASWGVGDKVTAAQVMECGERWTRYLEEEMQATAVDSEVPFTWQTEAGQRVNGWLDQLVTTDSGPVVVDHKTYPGKNPVGHVVKEHLGQMDVYRRALNAAGKPPAGILIHLPLRGEVLEVVLS